MRRIVSLCSIACIHAKQDRAVRVVHRTSGLTKEASTIPAVIDIPCLLEESQQGWVNKRRRGGERQSPTTISSIVRETCRAHDSSSTWSKGVRGKPSSETHPSSFLLPLYTRQQAGSSMWPLSKEPPAPASPASAQEPFNPDGAFG